MIKKTWLQKGLPYASELALKNCKDLLKILEWNEDNGIKVFRMSSEIFPWMSEYEFEDLPDYEEICKALGAVGDYATLKKHRLSFHPGPFNVLGSKNPNVVTKTIKELNSHSSIFNLMGLTPSFWNKINIHVGTAQDGLDKSAERFCKGWHMLDAHTQKRLTVENDDKASMFSTKSLYEKICSKIPIPIVHDFHHHEFCNSNILQSDAIEMAFSTWQGIKPVTHYSESRSIEKKDDKIKHQAHSDYIVGPIHEYKMNFDCVIEAKMKEQALLQYRSSLQ